MYVNVLQWISYLRKTINKLEFCRKDKTCNVYTELSFLTFSNECHSKTYKGPLSRHTHTNVLDKFAYTS